MKTLRFLMIALAFVLTAGGAFAQAKPAAAKPAPVAPAAADAKSTGPAEVRSKDFATVPESVDRTSPVEKPNTTYHFVGLRYRETWIPKFMINLFGDGGANVAIPMVGPEFTIRRNHFEYVLSSMMSWYSMGDPQHPVPFKASTDPDVAYEMVDANLKVLYFMGDFLWSTELDPQFAVDYGAGLGVGIVWGDIHRQQAYPPGGQPGDPYTYQPCAGIKDPPYAVGTTPYCNGDNTHYGNYTEPSWANNGSKPIIFPWLAVQTGFRFKPVHQFMMRLDLGWNLFNGPFIGIAGNYGI
jgi:hypothetical protein